MLNSIGTVRKLEHKTQLQGEIVEAETWFTDCPVCGHECASQTKYGPYNCHDCNEEFMAMVEGWVDYDEYKERQGKTP